MPVMHMVGMDHSTPVDSITDNGDGTYTCIVYYLMSSVMSGKSKGYWELEVERPQEEKQPHSIRTSG